MPISGGFDFPKTKSVSAKPFFWHFVAFWGTRAPVLAPILLLFSKNIQNKNCILRGRWVVTKSCKEMAIILVSTNPAPINDKIVGI